MGIRPTSFKFTPETRAEIDRLAAFLEKLTGNPHSRAEAIRWAVRQAVVKFEKNEKSGS